MECFNCEGDNVFLYYSENLDCTHCGEVLNVEYWVCKDCHLAWKECDGKAFACVDVDDIMTSEEAYDIFGTEEDPEPLVDCDFEDYIHRCLKCNSICYEPAPNLFVCSNSNCNFEWEVGGIE